MQYRSSPPHLIGAAYAILVTAAMAAVLCGLLVWWSMESAHRPPFRVRGPLP